MTSGHVIICSIGPVHGFIGAARRTRDLWFGSRVLASLSRIVALAVLSPANGPSAGDQGELVFPPKAALDDISNEHISNHVVGVLSASVVPSEWLETVKARIGTELSKLGDDCLRQFQHNRQREAEDWVDVPRFKSQLADTFELRAAWAKLSNEHASNYQTAYRSAALGLAARAVTRDFTQIAATSGGGRRKSSLDGVFDSVLTERWGENNARAQRMRDSFGIERLEGLDALGLIKRVLGREQRYPALTRVALTPWVEKIQNEAPTALADISEALERLIRSGLVTSAPYPELPYDGQLLLRADWLRQLISRQQHSATASSSGAHTEPTDNTEINSDATLALLRDLQALLTGESALGTPLLKRFPLPSPYVALLMADGDGMGAKLWELKSKDEHQAFSEKLLDYANQSAGKIEQLGGRLIYAGGDDVFALLPVHSALKAARALRDAFEQTGLKATQSIGVAFAHVLTPLGQLRRLAADALHHAKDAVGDRNRNALGIVIQPRGGGRLEARGRWDDAYPECTTVGWDSWIELWVNQMKRNGLPRGAATHLQEASVHAHADLGYFAAQIKRSLARRELSEKAQASIDAWFSKASDPMARLTREKAAGLQVDWHVARWLASHTEN